MIKIISLTLVVLTMLSLIEHIALKSTSSSLSFIRKLCWPFIKKKLVRLVKHRIILYPIIIQLNFDKTYKESYVKHGLSRLMDDVFIYMENLLEDYELAKAMIKTTTKKSNLSAEEIAFIEEFEEEEKKTKFLTK